jgi:putative membrane-bound dehydrogenase-like protein
MHYDRNFATPSGRLRHLLALVAVLTWPTPDASQAEAPSPVSAAESLRRIVLHPDCRIELVAAEPLVVDPIEVRFDARGRMWVVEMRDYPHGPAAGKPAQSRIRILEDRDSDGRYEQGVTFADELLFVTGVQPWGRGAIVTLAGRIDYLEDTTGDGRADKRETWYSGFAQENEQLRANHPRFGLDNQIYVANGLRAGAIVDARRPADKPRSLRGFDFRFDPRSGDWATVSGNGQFGMTIDDAGARFVCSNRNPLRQVMIEDRYVARSRGVKVGETAADVAAAGEASRVYPLVNAWTTSNLHAGQFTAACGATIYRGTALPAEFAGNAFICEPTGSLVHREVLSPAGATFTSRPGREGVEFLASRDPWFRPVNLEVGPDGALYVVDMYRAVIEHPQWMPEELKNRRDMLLGNDRGRIYRIVAKDAKTDPPALPLPGSTTEELVRLIAHDNTWQRATAARLLYERQGKPAHGSLEKLAAEGPSPAARTRALWALEGLGRLNEATVRKGLRDKHANVRRQAVLLAERHWAESPDLRAEIVRLSSDKDAAVRYQVALSLTPVAGETEVEALRDIALAATEDPWTRQAVVISAGPRVAKLLAALLAKPSWSGRAPTTGEQALIVQLVDSAGSAADEKSLVGLLGQLVSLAENPKTVRAAQAAIARLAEQQAPRTFWLMKLAARDRGNDLLARLDRVMTDCVDAAVDPKAAEADRLVAIRLAAHNRSAMAALTRLARDDGPLAIRLAAIDALSKQLELDPWEDLLGRFRTLSPPVRRAVLSAVLTRPERIGLLLERVAAGEIKPGEIDRDLVDRLLKHRDKAVQARVREVLADAIPADRVRVLKEYQSALALAGDAERGRQVFRKSCAACHRVGEVGVNVAPDISDSRTKTPAALLQDIVQPNRAIVAGYISYAVIIADGRTLTGILSAETQTSITLRQAEGKSTTLAKDDIDEIRSQGVSLMPEGLERDIPPQAMADLLAFIKNWRYLDGRTPLGRPK